MKFQEFKYERPNYEEIKVTFTNYLDNLKQSKDIDSFMETFESLEALRDNIDTMSSLCHVRYTINTNDEFYSGENEYWDEHNPLFQELDTQFYQVMSQTPFKEELRKNLPDTFYPLIENGLKIFKPEIIEDLQEENKLVTQYSKLIASAQIPFDGETYTIPKLKSLGVSSDRDIRKRSSNALMGYFEEHEAEFDQVYDSLVKVRDRIAKKLGFQNYIEYGYLNMNRLDYDQEMVENYRKQILKDMVPVANELYKKQQARLGLDELTYYDVNYEFKSGNPTPKGSPEELVQVASKMYHELSKETGEFFDMMVNQDLLDLVSKDGKMGGGYCTYFADYKVPFIFSNFNGTSGDVDVLTHEAGHAFQVYSSRHIKVKDCLWPTYESAEIHSMSMEFFAWSWMNLFFKEDQTKYYYTHLGDAVKFVPYGVLVDHYQHEVYAKPEMSPAERKACWRALEKQYLPHKNYEGCDILERGGWWFQQGHIFQNPFYYIDYTLAQVCALQFWNRLQKKDANAWSDYQELCKQGGTKSFLNLLKVANLRSPFEDGCLSDVMHNISTFLDGIDDKSL